MHIQTKYLGEIEITGDDILSFPWGLFGFSDNKEFVLLDIQGNIHFKFLQDIRNSQTAFLLINPWDFFKDYSFDLPDDDLKKLGIENADTGQIAVYNIVTLGQIFRQSTANLLAPIVLNTADKKGRQFILNDFGYTTRHALFTKGDE